MRSPRYYGWCEHHEKRTFNSRKQARAAARSCAEPGLRAYRCDQVYNGWHLGHLPSVVRQGFLTAAEVFRWRRHAQQQT